MALWVDYSNNYFVFTWNNAAEISDVAEEMSRKYAGKVT
jgi:hypothetical protein